MAGPSASTDPPEISSGPEELEIAKRTLKFNQAWLAETHPNLGGANLGGASEYF